MSFYSSSDSEESSSDDAEEPVPLRIVLHMDVDYFYAQCEELELDDSSKQRPIAVGQKHIIVTCNYVARAQGVQKLMLQTEARKNCPSLLIVDGSDLERYRRYSTQIYQTLRQEMSSMSSEYDNASVAMKKGGMDEVACDITALVDAIMSNGNMQSAPQNSFIYGDEDSSVVLKEDQSGAQCTVSHLARNEPTSNNQANIQQRLHVAATCAERLRQAIYTKTRFTTSIGVSTSPMLSKIASSLQKPNGLSVLYPWRATFLIHNMPLRSIPQLGSKTLKSLISCLEGYSRNRKVEKDSFWTCRDLLQVPRHEVLTCLQTMNMTEPASEALCNDLMNKCRGVDDTRIIDDGGGLSKTVSVENSFRRNTVRTTETVIQALQDLCWRLPRLLDDRRNNSHSPDQAYPTTIRVTAGVVDERLVSTKRRPFVTKSKQGSFAPMGKALMGTIDEIERSDIVQNAVRPLINTLLLNGSEINVVRLNIAVTGFQDLTVPAESPSSPAASPWAAFAMKRGPTEQGRSDCKRSKSQASISNDIKQKKVSPTLFAKTFSATSKQKGRAFVQPSIEIDPAVLAELPADIQAELLRTCNNSNHVSEKHTIDHFFSKK